MAAAVPPPPPPPGGSDLPPIHVGALSSEDEEEEVTLSEGADRDLKFSATIITPICLLLFLLSLIRVWS